MSEVPAGPPLPGLLRAPLLLALRFCHYLVIPYSLLSWLVSDVTWLTVHLIFVPAMILQWRLNDDVCMLNNIEAWLQTGRWRNPDNPEEGGWIRNQLERVLGLRWSKRTVDRLIYGLLTVAWLLSAGHLFRLLGGGG